MSNIEWGKPTITASATFAYSANISPVAPLVYNDKLDEVFDDDDAGVTKPPKAMVTPTKTYMELAGDLKSISGPEGLITQNDVIIQLGEEALANRIKQEEEDARAKLDAAHYVLTSLSKQYLPRAKNIYKDKDEAYPKQDFINDVGNDLKFIENHGASKDYITRMILRLLEYGHSLNMEIPTNLINCFVANKGKTK